MPVSDIVEIAGSRAKGFADMVHLPWMIGEKAHASVQGVRASADHIDNRPIGAVAPSKQNSPGLQRKILGSIQSNLLGGSVTEPDL